MFRSDRRSDAGALIRLTRFNMKRKDAILYISHSDSWKERQTREESGDEASAAGSVTPARR